MAVIVPIIVTGEADLAQLQTKLQQIERTGKKTGSSLASSFKGAASSLGLLVGVSGLVLGTKRIIEIGAEAEETRSKFNAVFKDMAESTLAWADEFGDSIGRSRLSIERFLATLQDTFVPLGFARAQAADLSKQLVELAFDVASFNNVADEQVVRDFQSALVGNTETVRKYGIVITEARLLQEALNSGLIESKRALTEQEKVQLRLNLIMSGTTDAQGDLLRTSDSLTNVSKELNANWEKFAIILSETVNPILRDALIIINNLISPERTQIELLDRIKEVESEIENLESPINRFFDVFGTREEKVETLKTKLAELKDELFEMVKITEEDIPVVDTLGEAIENRIVKPTNEWREVLASGDISAGLSDITDEYLEQALINEEISNAALGIVSENQKYLELQRAINAETPKLPENIELAKTNAEKFVESLERSSTTLGAMIARGASLASIFKQIAAQAALSFIGGPFGGIVSGFLGAFQGGGSRSFRVGAGGEQMFSFAAGTGERVRLDVDRPGQVTNNTRNAINIGNVNISSTTGFISAEDVALAFQEARDRKLL